MKKRWIALVLCCCAAAEFARPSPALAANEPVVGADAQPPIRYTVRRGDNLYTLALHYMHRLEDYHVVQRLNKVRNPYSLPIASTLLIPRPLLQSDPLDAKIIAFRGATTVDGNPATLGTAIREGVRITTGANAFLSIGLNDGSTITLPSQSQMRVERLRRYRLTGELERLFRLEDGRSQTRVTPRTNGRDRFEMRTPISVAAVRGTNFRVSVLDGGSASTAEVLEGHVGLEGGGSDTLLDAGLGARVANAGATGPVKLLPPPGLVDPERVQSAPQLQFRIDPVPQAVSYRVQIARDAGFLDIAEETLTDGATPTLPPVDDGDWFVRLTAIDRNALEGLPRVIGFERRLNALRATAERLPGGHRYLFKWEDMGQGVHRYRLVIAREGAPDLPVIDEPALTARSFVATDLPPGDYVWSVQTTEMARGKTYSSWTSPQTLTVPGKVSHKFKRAQPTGS